MTCGRIWEAEAIEDGRLEASSVDSFERHAAVCTDCTKEVERLKRLQRGRVLLEPRRLTAFEHRRRRAELLRRANSEALHSPRGNAFFVLFFAAAALVTAFIVFRVERRPLPSAASKAAATASLQPKFELRAIGTAEWRDATAGSIGRVVLAAGTLGVHVEHLTNGQRFVLSLPDGELEVHGTRFIVEVKDGYTERVLVTEGVVSLRLKSARQRTLTAGDSYIASGIAGAPSNATDAAVRAEGAIWSGAIEDPEHARRTEVRAARPPSNAVGAHASLAAARSTLSPARDTPPATTGPQIATSSTNVTADFGAAPRADADAGESFHKAMAAFSLGAYAEADERFAEFAAGFPNDSRDEDAAFLRTVIALRRGDPSTAVVRARAYLRRFPDGLRRPEVERMLATTTSR